MSDALVDFLWTLFMVVGWVVLYFNTIRAYTLHERVKKLEENDD